MHEALCSGASDSSSRGIPCGKFQGQNPWICTSLNLSERAEGPAETLGVGGTELDTT